MTYDEKEIELIKDYISSIIVSETMCEADIGRYLAHRAVEEVLSNNKIIDELRDENQDLRDKLEQIRMAYENLTMLIEVQDEYL